MASIRDACWHGAQPVWFWRRRRSFIANDTFPAAARADRGHYLSLWSGQGAALSCGRPAGCCAAELIDALDAEWRAASKRISGFAAVE